MAKGYLEQYLESVETLPSDLQRNFDLMKELDTQAENESHKVEGKCKAFLEGMGGLSAEERKERLEEIQKGFNTTIHLGDQKVSLAVQTYETVDTHIRQLDDNLSQLDAENESPDKSQRKRQGSTESSVRKRSKSYSVSESIEDMPVDPNEPTYCLCHQVSYGEMIACDNADCPTEWFHFGCVNLAAQPTTKWYCPACTLQMEKRK